MSRLEADFYEVLTKSDRFCIIELEKISDLRAEQAAAAPAVMDGLEKRCRLPPAYGLSSTGSGGFPLLPVAIESKNRHSGK